MPPTPTYLASNYSLTELCECLFKAKGLKHTLVLEAIRIHLDRLWRPFE